MIVDRAKRKRRRSRYTVRCGCGNEMRVRPRHVGRMCRCTQCSDPIYVTVDNVRPRLDPHHKKLPRMFSEQEVPVYWIKGDLLMELYEVREEIDEGGMATVYRIRHRGWDTDLAVKFPKPELIPDELWMETFERECATWVDLPPHPNVVECYYVRRLGGVPRVFMEYVPSMDLGRMIRGHRLYTKDPAENLQRMLDVLIQFAWGIDHAHRRGVIHQDVKPPNVLVMEDFSVKVTDFGLARVLPEMEEQTGGTAPNATGKFPRGGTPVYRAPEQEKHKKPTIQTDMWGWGLSALELFAGGIFWRKGPLAAQALEDFRAEGSDFSFIPPMPEKLDDILAQCFEDYQNARPKSMSDIANVLVDIYETELGRPYPRPHPESGAHSQEARNNRAVSFLDLGRNGRSEILWKELLDEAPDFFPAVYNRDLYLWRMGGITDAQMVEKVREQADAEPLDTRRQYLLARVALERGDISVARKILDPLYKSGEGGRDVAFAYAIAQSLVDRDRRKLGSVNLGVAPNAIAVSAGAEEVYVALNDGQVGRVIREPKREAVTLGKHASSVTALALSEQEAYVFSGASDGSIALWNAGAGGAKFLVDGHSTGVNAVAVSVSGRHGVSADRAGKLRLWDLRSGKALKTIQAHDSEATAVTFSRCGAYLLSGGADGSVRLWDTWSGDNLTDLRTTGQRALGVALDPDRKIAAAASGSHVELWSLPDGEPIIRFKAHEDEICSFVLTFDFRYAMTATPGGIMKLWDIQTGQCLRVLRLGAPAALSADGRFAVGTNRKGRLEYWAVYLDSPPFAAPYLISHRVDEDSTDE